MARITPGSSGPITKLEDFVKYPAKVQEAFLGEERTYTNADGTTKTSTPIVVKWQLSDDVEDTLRINYGQTVKQRQDGKPSALRAMLNAVAGHEERDVIAWFDNESFEFGYPDGSTHRLAAGAWLNVVGRSEPSSSEASKVYFNVITYSPKRVKAAPAKVATPAAFPPVAEMPARDADELNIDSVPF